MEISIRKNTCDSSLGEIIIDGGHSKLEIGYDRDDLAHELINSYRDLFDSADDWLEHLSRYLDDREIEQLRAK